MTECEIESKKKIKLPKIKISDCKINNLNNIKNISEKNFILHSHALNNDVKIYKN